MTGKTVYFRLPETEQKHKNSVTQEMLGKSISRAFRSYKAQFPQYSSKEYETVAKQFCEDFFLADETIVANFANLSLQDNSEKKISLSIRISSHPVFNQHIPHNIAVAVIGYCPTATGSPVFIPERVFLTHGGMDATAYEKQVETHFYQLQENSYPSRSQPNLLSSDFTKSLPAYAAKTKERLSGWLDFLTFKNKLIKHKTQGLRYLNWQFNEQTGQVHFLVIAEDEQVLRKARAAFSRQNLHAFKRETSDQPFRFLLPKKDASRVESAFSQLGQLAKDGVKIIQFNHSDKAKVKACEDYRKTLQQENAGGKNQFDFSKAVFADVFVDISEELSNKISQFEDNTNSDKQDGNQHTRQDKIDHLFRNLPKNGFLSISLVGDLALIERHRRAVKNLQQNEGCYAPYLSSYLFDIENANQPDEIPEITEWENKSLNDKQKSAVQKMLAAPDICLIQGPPGTGKTTVIAEACLQFAKRGETVLLASQAHDALDNALSRLQNHPELRAVRLAKSANRITEEGKQFTGESILSKHYVSLRNYVAKEYLQPFNALSEETEKLREWVKQAEFVAHDLQQLREEYRTNQGRLKQAEQALAQAQTEFATQQDAFKQQSRDVESITQLIGLLKGEDSGEALRHSDFALSETFHPLVEHIITEFNHLKINQPFSYERFLVESENQTAILYALIQRYRRIQAVLPKMEADLARLNSSNGAMGADTKTLLEIERLQQEIDEIADKMENDDSDELSTQWKEKRKALRLLKEKPSEGLNSDTYQIFDDAERFTQNNPEAVRPLLMQRIQKLKWFQQQYQSLALATVWDLNNQLQGYDLQLPSDEAIQEKQADLESLKEAKHQVTERGRLKKQQAAQILTDGGFSAEADFLKEFAEQQNRLNELENNLQDLQTKNRDFMPLFTRWQEILKEPEKSAEKDWSELEKPFVGSCNLVAITCNENERTLTDNNFDGFDVVIIDEVSKATPLEMLLPLMRAKKAILVGDHRQLPPIFNEADGLTFEDEVEQNEAQENKQDSDTDLTEDNLHKFEKMVTASLFKELFEKAPESLRERLNIQFRMHPDIMKMINYFYERQLTCGNPDAKRPHGIEFKGLLSQKDHVLWIDTTDDEKGKRFSINDGQSNINVLEARMIAKTLVDMNRQLETLGYGKDNKMKVGVVSFYQPQCRVIRDEIRKINKDKLSFSAIDVEINTVIRYQGKEKPIILLSLVKNNGGDRTQKFRAGRANIARFEFINVAMSRAQNLLLIFGARNMLENREVKLPRMDKAGYDKEMVYKNMFKYLEHWAETGGICDAKEFSAILPNIQPQQKGRR